MNESTENLTKTIVAYIAHDPIGNIEGYVSDYSKDALEKGEASGIVFIAEYNDGSRALVKAADIVEPSPSINGIEIVTTAYVDKRTDAIISVFDAIDALVNPATSTTDAEACDTSSTIDPVEAFTNALKRLKELVSTGGSAA